MPSFIAHLARLFDRLGADPDGWMPHGHCMLWSPWVLGPSILSDIIIALAYFTIPPILFVLSRRRPDLFPSRQALAFAVFILACGCTHVLDVLTMYVPWYRALVAAKLVTAMASAPTAFRMVTTYRRMLALPRAADLAAALAAAEDAERRALAATERAERLSLEIERRDFQ